jgi:hypothetical protein
MADMPGESQEEPSVMVVAITCDDRLTSLTQMCFTRYGLLMGARNATQSPRHQLPIQSSC